MKKVITILMALVIVGAVVCGLAACNNNNGNDDGDYAFNIKPTYDYIDAAKLEGKSVNVGFIAIGDEQETYSAAHINGIKEAKKILEGYGASVNIAYTLNVGDGGEPVSAAINSYATSKDLIITNSYGHQFDYGTVYETYPGKTFVSMTGDLAATTDANNYKNAFTDVYQARYVAGVVGGLKLKELVDGKKLTKENYNGANIKIGYVGAFNYQEVISGYTAFYLGVKSVVSNVTMEVVYTNSWHDEDEEKQKANILINDGCVLISEHADSYGAPLACEAAMEKGKIVYNVGYNQSTKEVAPKSYLAAATNNWVVYYTKLLYTALTDANGAKAMPTDWSAGYTDGAVKLTDINTKVFKNDPTDYVTDVVGKLAAGTLQVFDVTKFTVGGKTLSTTTDQFVYGLTVDNVTPELIKTAKGITYFSESTYRSAPYFGFIIDGIVEK